MSVSSGTYINCTRSDISSVAIEAYLQHVLREHAMTELV